DVFIKATLRQQGVNPLKVKKKAKPLFGGGKKKITSKDITTFSRQLATMMSAGVPLVQSFEIVARGLENKGMQDLLLAIKADIEAGGTLAEALGKHPAHFDRLYINLVTAGEAAGILESILHKIATYLEKTEALKSKIKSAMFYPIAVIVVAFVITAILMIFVIPQFESLFKGFGADLPALTKLVITISEYFQEYWWAIFGGLVGTVMGVLKLKKRSTKAAQLFDRLSLKLPVVGKILEQSAVARFSRTLATMFAAGTPLVEAMTSVAGACGNIVFYDAAIKIRDEITTGTQLQVAMRDAQIFPNMVIQMVAIGEESGALDEMLGKVADWYEQQVDDAVEALTSLLEPIIMAVLGVIIGGLVIAMYLPIFKMGQAI
ncbi:MAG TPA: type II secretion system F family protein, partial [Gammaproteobacteria bacterium]|nr:type II secretion system F family protein [Gammaproteobacteria bacterium]